MADLSLRALGERMELSRTAIQKFELAHLVLDGRRDPALELDEEKACHRFAGSFLLPREALVQELGSNRNKLEWREVAGFKQQFGLSMAAALFRARDTGVITEAIWSSLWIQFPKLGWQKQEPIQTPQGNAHVF